MKRSFLEKFDKLTKEEIDEILNENGRDLENTKSTLNEEIAKLKNDVSTRDNQFEELKKSVKSSEDLEAKIAELQNKNKADAEAHAKEIRDININAAVKDALTNAKAKNQDVIKPLLAEFLSKAEINEGVVQGLDEEIKKLVEGENTSFLFDNQVEKVQTPDLTGFTPADGKDLNKDTFDKSTATYEQLVEYQNAHPEINIFKD